MNVIRNCPKCNAPCPENVRFCGNCGTHLETGVKPRINSDPLIGSLVGDRFVVIEKIGQGGMGVVYRAEQTGIWRPVALKVLRPRFSQDKMLHERFRIEAATASRLTHPNTITIYDFGVTNDGGLYIAMEMLEGVSLDQEIINETALDWQRACRIGIQLCGSLQEAHEFNIIHRDLKPENVMLTNRGYDTDVVKVLDFGIAKIMSNEGETTGPALTAGNELFGTPEYMSPEQIRGDVLDNRSDIYSLGAIFYQMLSGIQPYRAATPIAVLTRHLTEEIPPLIIPEGKLKPPAELEVLILSCMAKGRDDRPASMQEIAESLKRFLGETTPIQPNRSRNNTGAFQRRPQTNRLNRPHTAKQQINRNTGRNQAQASPDMALGATMAVQPAELQQLPPVAAPAVTAAVSRDDIDKGKDIQHSPEPGFELIEDVDIISTLPDTLMEEEVDDQDLEDDIDEETRDLPLKEATLTLLQKRMKSRGDFPAMSQNVVELNTKAMREDTSAQQLSNVILKDFALTSKLLKLVNSPFYSQYRGRVMTISRAVVIMGFEEVRQIALGLMLFDRLERVHPKQARVLKDEALSALMSGLLAKKLAQQSGDLDPEAVLICGMFHRLGKYLAFFYLPQKSREVRRLIIQSKMNENTAALKILGLTFTEIGKWISKEWQLPNQIGEAMEAMPGGPLSKPKGIKEKTRMMVGFADEMVMISQKGHRGNRSTSLKTLARRFGNMVPTDENLLSDIMMTTTGEIREYAKILDLNIRDSSFVARLLNWNGIEDIQVAPLEERFSDIPDLELPEIPQITTGKDSFTERKNIFTSGIEEITLAMTRRYDLNGLILMVLETMYRGLGLSRVVFLLNDIKTNTMVARSGFGEGVEELIRQFRFQPRRGRDFFNQAVWRGKDVIVHDTSQPRNAEKLPAWYRRVTTSPIVVLYPVMLKNIPAGLFYGDVLTTEHHVNRGLLVHMDRLRNLTARAIREKRVMG